MSEPYDLNGIRMNAVQTAENGVVNAETEFAFRQSGTLVFAEYRGGGVLHGSLVGLLEGSRLTFRYAQLQVGDVLNGGRSECEVAHTDDGRLQVVEHFQWESRPGGGTNVFEEIPGIELPAPIDWRALFERWARRCKAPAPRFHPPAPAGKLAELQHELGIELPAELRALLETSDGVEDARGYPLVWSAETLALENGRYRRRTEGLEDCMSFDELLFFSDAPGNGDAYAFCLPAPDGTPRERIFRWDHEDDSRQHVARSLAHWVAEEL